MRLLTFLLAAAIGIATTIPSHAADRPTVIRIGVPGVGFDGSSPRTTGTTGTVAGKGLLEKEFAADGIEVQWTFFKGAGPALNESLANGLLDFAAGLGDLPAVIHRASGLKTQILLATGRLGVYYIVVPSDSRAKTIHDLKGKRISVFKGTATQLGLNRIFALHGYTEKDFKVLNFDTATSRGAIATRDIDGYIAASDAFALRDRGVGRIIYSSQEKAAETASTGALLVTEAFEAKYPDLVQRLVNVWVKEAAWNSDESQRIEIFKAWSRTGQPFSTFKEDYNVDTLSRRLSPLIDEYFVDHYRQAREQAIEFKLLRNTFDVDSWFNRKYLDEALKVNNLVGYWSELDAKGAIVKVGRTK